MQIRKWCLIFLGIAVGSLLAGTLQLWSLGVIGAAAARSARAAAFARILRMEVGWFDKPENGSGRLTTKLQEDATFIRGAVGDQVSVLAQNLSVMGTGFAIAFSYSWKLTLVRDSFAVFLARHSATHCCVLCAPTVASAAFVCNHSCASSAAVAFVITGHPQPPSSHRREHDHHGFDTERFQQQR